MKFALGIVGALMVANFSLGYQLTGGIFPLICRADGTWSVPICTPRPCNALSVPTNGALSPAAPHNYNVTVTFTCDAGYIRNGTETTACQTDGTWSNPVPTCTQIEICVPNPCKNGGTCTDRDSEFQCACLTGYEGDTCQTAEAVYEDVRTPGRAVSQRSGTGSDVYYSYPMAPLPVPPLPVQPSGHYQELRPAVYQSLQRHQRTSPQPPNPTGDRSAFTISRDFST
uniref:Sushi domain-containing protein n=1 Tax=Branchiostoma floridae TaxID=7739 RepID=C3XSW8_BRAFL|eukprot:XP_002612827.1 hypothetical protein BRAFLDRAFT_67225 [Branchiostoma floridae]